MSNEAQQPQRTATILKRIPIFLCEMKEGPVGFTATAEGAVEWSMSVNGGGNFVRITKLWIIHTKVEEDR
jgi:hypothetical protein